MTAHTVIGHGGVRLHVREAGPADAPAILLIHGWSQHHLSWSKQLEGKLADEFRLVAPDLRGHGASGKPDDPAAYDNSAPWAGDIAAIIDRLGLRQPLLVGWSMGGWIACDYLRHHGDGAISGLVLIGSGVIAVPGLQRRPEVAAEGMYSEDQAEALAATIAFVRACTNAPLSKRDMAMMVGFNMLVPPHVRRACRLRGEDYTAEMAALTKPALILHGEAERVCTRPMFEAVRAALPKAEVRTYPGCGHAPFREAPEKSDADLAAFARHVMEAA